MRGRVLIVAGSDSGGGAGIQADIKTVTALGGYAATAVTALTAQDTEQVRAVLPVEPGFVALQMALALDDIGADAIKTGMLGNADVIDAVVDILESRASTIPLVVDPVLAATSGQALLDEGGLLRLKTRLLPRATLATPNIPEARRLLGRPIADRAGMRDAALDLLKLGCRAVLLKGGHLEGATVTDMLATAEGAESFEAEPLATRHTHGTGCTLASAVATGLAQGLPLRDAIRRARAYVREAIRTAPGFGRGHGPLNHAHTVRPFAEG